MTQWSKYSEALFDMYLSTDSDIIVQACPGAGKTTNIKHLWTLDDKSSVYLVFNKQNQLEAQEKLPMKQGSDVLTLNGLGHRALINAFGRVNLDKNKILSIVDKAIAGTWHGLTSSQVREQKFMLARAVSKAKMISERLTDEQYDGMLSMYDLESYPGMLFDVRTIVDYSDEMAMHKQHAIDFDDQIRVPALYAVSLPEYHNVLGDEVQDFNAMQALLVSKLNAHRYVFVGDKRQSIYGFRGAMNDSMEYLKDRFNCTDLPLSITYRCSRAVVAEAYAVWPDIEVWDKSPDGSVSTCNALDESLVLDQFRTDSSLDQHMVLCRMNRPLIAYAYALLHAGIPCHVRGRDIGEGLIRLIKKLEVSTVSELIEALALWREVETAKAADDEVKLQSIEDKHGSLMLFIDRCKLSDPVQVVAERINAMFEQGKGVCLSTVHKAKGLEAVRAYMLEAPIFDYCAHRAKQAWQAEQERNVKYVAITRARSDLIYM